MKNSIDRSILIGNGININFGGNAYTNNYIIKRIVFNAKANKYDPIFNNEIGGDEIASIFVELANWANDISAEKYDAIIPEEEKHILEDFKLRYNWKLTRYYEVGLEDRLCGCSTIWLFHIVNLVTTDKKQNSMKSFIQPVVVY